MPGGAIDAVLDVVYGLSKLSPSPCVALQQDGRLEALWYFREVEKEEGGERPEEENGEERTEEEEVVVDQVARQRYRMTRTQTHEHDSMMWRERGKEGQTFSSLISSCSGRTRLEKQG